ncbi:MAG: hypothetical protein LUH20_13085 [Lachnospiraceae bacterium]|nr:hypothetical protein [Lachnospiraceae bacterium]
MALGIVKIRSSPEAVLSLVWLMKKSFLFVYRPHDSLLYAHVQLFDLPQAAQMLSLRFQL